MTLSISTFSRNGHLAPRRVDVFSEVSKELDHAMNHIFGSDFFTGLSKKGKGYPLMDAIRTDKNLILQYSVPGVKSEDLDIEITDDEQGKILTISGFLHEDYVAKDQDYQIRELSGQEFKRIIRLPSDLEEKDPAINLKDGILIIKFDISYKESKLNSKVKKLKIN